MDGHVRLSRFTCEAEQKGRQQEFLVRLYGAFEQGHKWLEGKVIDFPEIGTKDSYALKAFTDNIVIGWPVLWDDAEAEFNSAIFTVSVFQLEMASAGFFLRGAVSVGDAYIDDIAVVGSAVTEAYKGESKLALDPRIVLTGSAILAVGHHRPPPTCYLKRDPDGQSFLNYLETILLAEEEQGPDYEQLLQHKAAVELNLNRFRHSPKIWKKYAWVAAYHNHFCDQYPRHFKDTHKISLLDS